MSWLSTNFSGGLSNITGQISSFTREMLTEGTEEVADVPAELKIARERIQELEAVISSQRSEYESVKSLNAELHDRVEAAEMQTHKMKQDYRSQIENKERELIELREQLQEKEHWQYDAGFDRRGYSGSVSDDDIEIHRLQKELTKLQRENAQLRKETVGEQESEKLHKQVDEHQHELATLQASHSQKIASLTRKYKNDMKLWQKEKEDFLNTIDKLESSLQEHQSSDAPKTTSVLGTFDQKRVVVKGLMEKDCNVTTLSQEVDELRDESQKSAAELLNWKSSVGKLEEELSIIKQQKKELEAQLEKCCLSEQQKCHSLEQSAAELLNWKSSVGKLEEELSIIKQQKKELEAQLEKCCLSEQQKCHSLEQSAAELLNWKSSVGKLEEELSIIKQQKKELEAQLEKCCLSEQQKCHSLEQVKEEIGLLSSATEELMEELEVSHSFQKEQKVEIESLKTICTIKGDVTEEVVRLKDALTALWERYVSVMGQYHKVRLELHTSNQRLLAQLQASHSHVRELRQDFSVTQNKILDSNMDKLDQVHQEKQTLMLKSSEVRMCVEEQESAVIDLHSDNEQVLQEAKMCVAEIGCQAVSEDESTDLVSSLQAEKALLETTIVGLEHKVQDLKEEVLALRGTGPSEHEMENEYESLESRDSMCHAKMLAKSSNQQVQNNDIEEAVLEENDIEGYLRRQNLMVSNLQQELEEYRRFTEVYEEDKEALEEAIMDSRKLLKQSEKQNQAVTAERERLLQSFRDLDRDLGKKLNIAAEDGICGFENEVDRFEVFSAQLKEWVARNEDEKAADAVDSGSKWSNVSLDEESHTERSIDEESDSFRQTIAELELDNSVLREQTEKLISDLDSKAACVATLQDELDKKCHELEGLQNERISFVAQLTENEQKLSELEESFESERLELTTSRDESINVLQQEQQDMLNMLQEKQKEAGALKNDNHRLMSLLQDKQQENDEMTDKNESLNSLVSESEKLLEDLKSEKEMILSQLDENLKAKESVSNDNSTLSDENCKLKESLQDRQQKLDFNEDKIAQQSALNLEVENLKAKLTDSAKDKRSLDENINILNLAKASIQGSLESRNKEVDTLKTVLSEKTSEVKLLKSEQDRLNEVISTTSSRVKELEQSLKLSVSEKEELSQSLHSKDVEIGQLQLDVREKGAQNDFLRLDLAKVSKTLKEKEHVLHLSSGSENDAPEYMERKLKTMLKLIEEKDYEMEALKQKDASLMELVTESDKSSVEIREHYEEQIQQLRSERERVLAELSHKDEELLTVNDRMEAMRDKMSGKDQASAMLHSEHMKLVSLNQSQGNDIAKLRAKNDALLKLLGERDKIKRHEDINRIQDENNRLSQQIGALHSEQERLLIVIHEKDKQLKSLVQASEPQIKISNPLQELLAERKSEFRSGHSVSKTDSEKEAEITGLRSELSRLRGFLNEKQKVILNLTERNDNLEEQADKLAQEISVLEKKSSLMDDDKITSLEEKLDILNNTVGEKEKEMSDAKKHFSEQRNDLLQQLETARTGSREAEHLKDKEITDLKNKVTHLFSSMKAVDSGLEGVTCDLSTSASIELSLQALIQAFRTLWTSTIREKDYEISCLKEKVANLSVLSSSHETPSGLHLENALKEKEELSQQLLKTRQEYEDVLDDKDQFESNFQEQLLALSKGVSEKEKELRALCERSKKDKIDFERLQLEKESLDAINAERQAELERLQARIHQSSSDGAEQRDNLSKLSEVVGEYKQVMDERERKIDQLMGEKRRQEQNAQFLTQRVASLEHELIVAVNDKKGADDKLNKELERLRGHLIMVEESYTREALLAEERERDLGERLERAEEQLVSSSSSLKDTSRQATQQRESLQEQLHVIASQRDEAIMQLSTAQEQTQQYSMALQNLQMVLEQFQREKDDQLSLAREQAQKEVEKAKAETVQMHHREADLRNQLGSAARVLQEVGVLKQQLVNKDEEIAKWKVEVGKMEEEARVSQQKIKALHTNNDAKVDKVLLKNLLLSYFHTPETKRSDAIHVLGGLLDFTPEEIAQVGSGSSVSGRGGGGWISSLLPFGGTPKTPTHKQPSVGTPTKASAADKSFSELFVSFLQHESESNSPLQTGGAGKSQPTNPLLHGIPCNNGFVGQAPLSQGHPSNMLHQLPTSAMSTGTRLPLGQSPQSGTRPIQSHLLSSLSGSSPPSSVPVYSPSAFATSQNSRSAAVPLRLINSVRPGQELPSLQER